MPRKLYSISNTSRNLLVRIRPEEYLMLEQMRPLTSAQVIQQWYQSHQQQQLQQESKHESHTTL